MTKTKALRELEAQVQGIQDAARDNRQAIEAAQDKFQEQIQESMKEQEQRLTDTLTTFQAQLLQTLKASRNKPESAQFETQDIDDLDAISVVHSTRSSDPMPPQHIPRNFDYSQVSKLPQAATLEDFRQWRKNWEANGRSKNLVYYPQHSQVSSLISAIGSHGSDIIEFSLGINPKEPHKNVTEILDELHKFFREERNLAVDRRAYFTRTQQDGETFREFYYALERLSRNACLHRRCESEECRQDLLVTMIMLGVRNENARKELMKIQPFPDLKKALATCSTEENTEDNTDRIARKDINKISAYKKDKKRLNYNRSPPPESRKCYYCAEEYSKDHRCTARNRTCNKCGRKGHIEKACKTRDSSNESTEDKHGIRSVSAIFCNNVMKAKEAVKPEEQYMPDESDENGICNQNRATKYEILAIDNGDGYIQYEAKPKLPTESMIENPEPKRIFEEVTTELFEVREKHFLIIMDKYSGWPEIYEMGNCPTTEKIITRLVNYCDQVGCPTRLLTNGEQQFASREMRDFLKRWGISHTIYSPQHIQSNELVEAEAKSVKALLKQCGGDINTKFSKGYIKLRNTPCSGGKSPAEIVYGQPMRSRLQAHHKAFDKKWQVSSQDHDAKMSKIDLMSVKHNNKSATMNPQLKVGMKVVMQDKNTKLWNKTGTIMSKGNNQYYRIKNHSGLCLWINRRFIKPLALPDTEENNGATTANKKQEKNNKHI